jgi:hypothetical protein
MARKKAPAPQRRPDQAQDVSPANDPATGSKRDRDGGDASAKPGGAKRGRFGRAEVSSVTVPLRRPRPDGLHEIACVMGVCYGHGGGGGGGKGVLIDEEETISGGHTHVRLDAVEVADGTTLTWRLLTVLDGQPGAARDDTWTAERAPGKPAAAVFLELVQKVGAGRCCPPSRRHAFEPSCF